MITVAGGDSMVWGSELKDSPHGGPNGFSRNTFTALVAEQGYTCAAYPGIGNIEIADRVKTQCEQLSMVGITATVLVCWTWPSRDQQINSDQQILELQDFLEFNNFNYLFTCVDNCIITGNKLINWDNWFLFPAGTGTYDTQQPRGFYQWAVENKYTVGPDGHPLEQAHQDAAILLRKRLDELATQNI
jgi:hypothetical protein